MAGYVKGVGGNEVVRGALICQAALPLDIFPHGGKNQIKKIPLQVLKLQIAANSTSKTSLMVRNLLIILYHNLTGLSMGLTKMIWERT